MTSAQRWEPTSEAAILAAIDDGSLVESHHFDAKREVGAGSGERADLARHLASFAIDGGTLLIGVEEDKANRTWRSAPQPLDGLPERLEQIATQLVDPPLYTIAREVPSESGDGSGYLLVEVPPSARAPHMVGGIYFGRGDRTRTRLSDAEVVRHHARREALESLTERLLDEEAARDPQPDRTLRQCGRLYAVAQPLTGPRQMALALLKDSHKLQDLAVGAEHLPDQLLSAEPSPHNLSYRTRRANGVALSSHSLTGPGRTLTPLRAAGPVDEESMLDLEIREDGGLRLLAGRLTAAWSGGRRPGPEQCYVVLDAIAVGYSLRIVHWARMLADETGYRGAWAFGVHGTGMRGLTSAEHEDGNSGGSRGNAYDAEAYREITTAVYRELSDQPEAVAERLVGRLTRALSTERHWSPALNST